MIKKGYKFSEKRNKKISQSMIGLKNRLGTGKGKEYWKIYHRDYSHKYNKKNKARLATLRKICAEKKPELYSSWYKKWRKNNPDKIRDRFLRKKYNITIEDYDVIFKKQSGLCAICGIPRLEGDRLVVDHCHVKNKVRGLLCRHCNTGIGFLKDNVDSLRKAIKYLKKHE